MPINNTEIEARKDRQQANPLIDFLAGSDTDALAVLKKYKLEQVTDRPFRIASLAYMELLRSNKGLQDSMFVDRVDIHLDTVKGWIEVLSVIPEGMAWHPDVAKESYPFLGEKIRTSGNRFVGYSPETPMHVLDKAKIIIWKNDYRGIKGNSGFYLNPGYLHLSMADRLNDPNANKKWHAQIGEYLALAERDLADANMQYNRVYVEKLPFDGKLTELIFHQVFAEVDGRKLTPDEEQKIIRESLTHQMEYANEMFDSFNNNRDGLVKFEDKVWEKVAEVVNK